MTHFASMEGLPHHDAKRPGRQENGGLDEMSENEMDMSVGETARGINPDAPERLSFDGEQRGAFSGQGLGGV